MNSPQPCILMNTDGNIFTITCHGIMNQEVMIWMFELHEWS